MDEQVTHFQDYLEIFRRRLGIAVLFCFTIVIIVTVGSFLMDPVYRATVTLLIDVESPDVLTTTGTVALEPQSYLSYKEYYQSQEEIITSMGIMRQVFNEFKLGSSKDYKGKKESVKQFVNTILVTPVRDTRLLKISVDNEDPKLAAQIANRIAEIYVKRNLYYISRDEVLNLLKNEYLQLQRKLSEYTKVYKGKHPKMIRLKQELKEMIEKIERAKNSTFNSKMLGNKNEQNEYLVIFEGFKANNVSIQDSAEVPEIPIKPKKSINIALAIVVGIFGGICMAFLFEYLDDTIKSVDDLARLTTLPFLGNVPDITKLSGRMNAIERDMLVHKNPKNPVAETYRSIRTGITFSSSEKNSMRVLSITSPGPQEGKTTTVCNVAIALAQAGKRILLVDGDLRIPRLHTIFDYKNEKGLSDFLSGHGIFEDLIQKTAVENLFLISGGPNPPNPSELLSGKKIEEFINAARKDFDMVLFDSPPIGVVTDAAVLARVMDGVILVVDAGKTHKRVFPRILNLFGNAKEKILGIVLNRISISKSIPYHYYYSHYYGK